MTMHLTGRGRRLAIAFAVALAVVPAAGAETPLVPSPYAGDERREIATLSAKDVDDLLAGRGWGFALAAELNGYPGPAHVLELAEELELTEAQRDAVEAIFAAMNGEARSLGAALVEAEAALSDAFDAGRIDETSLQALVVRAAEIEAELRAVHLAAHLETKPLMSRHQIMLYNGARGYDGGHGHGGGHSHD